MILMTHDHHTTTTTLSSHFVQICKLIYIKKRDKRDWRCVHVIRMQLLHVKATICHGSRVCVCGQMGISMLSLYYIDSIARTQPSFLTLCTLWKRAKILDVRALDPWLQNNGWKISGFYPMFYPIEQNYILHNFQQ